MRKTICGGCSETGGRPFDGECIVADETYLMACGYGDACQADRGIYINDKKSLFLAFAARFCAAERAFTYAKSCASPEVIE